jgi:Cep192 domain 4
MSIELTILRYLAGSLVLVGILGATGCAGVAGKTTSPASSGYDGPISVTASDLNFGNVAVGATRTLDVKFSNSGKSSVSLSQEAVVGKGFTTTGIGSNLTLAPGQTAVLTVTFEPGASGSATGSVTISTTQPTKPITILLRGNGVPASGHFVTLSWNPSGSMVVGYKVYRREGTEPHYKKVSSGVDRAADCGRSRSGFRADSDHHSELIPITVPE